MTQLDITDCIASDPELEYLCHYTSVRIPVLEYLCQNISDQKNIRTLQKSHFSRKSFPTGYLSLKSLIIQHTTSQSQTNKSVGGGKDAWQGDCKWGTSKRTQEPTHSQVCNVPLNKVSQFPQQLPATTCIHAAPFRPRLEGCLSCFYCSIHISLGRSGTGIR